jgi:hypothetical protein
MRVRERDLSGVSAELDFAVDTERSGSRFMRNAALGVEGEIAKESNQVPAGFSSGLASAGFEGATDRSICWTMAVADLGE